MAHSIKTVYVVHHSHTDIGSFYCGSLRVGGTIHRIHRPHSFPQFIYLLLCQCRNGCALFIS